MRISLILKKVTEYFVRRKFNFLLTTVVIIIAMYMLSMVLQMSVKSTYYIYETKNVFSSDEFINVNILMSDQDNNDYYDNVERFIEELESEYNSDMGKYMYLPTNYNVQGELKKENTLYVDSDMFDLCKLELYKDGEYSLLNSTGEEILYGYVCKNRLDEYPIGTIIKNENLSTITVIVGYFDEGSKWAPGLLLHEQDATICLDDYIISEMNEEYFKISNMFYANIFNSIYIKTDMYDVSEVKEDIKKIAEKCGVKCYVHTLNEIVDNEKDENADVLKAIGTMVIFSTFVAMTGIFSSFLADVFSWQKEIAIMSVNGVAPIDIYIIILLENLIKELLAFNIAASIYGNDLDKLDKSIYYHMIIPFLLMGIIIFVIVSSFVAFKSIKQDKLITIIGGEHL